MLLPIGLLAICDSSAVAINHEVTASGLHNKAFATVSGTVTDQNKQPLPGVSVFEKKTKKTTVTDPNGKYSINVEEGAILVFSYIGYDNQEVAVNGRQNINITLKESSNTLNEVVAIGYQKIRKSDVTGAISSVKASEMNLTSPTVGQALVGKVAGVQVSQTSGAPYSGTKIRVRGIGSINALSLIHI